MQILGLTVVQAMSMEDDANSLRMVMNPQENAFLFLKRSFIIVILEYAN